MKSTQSPSEVHFRHCIEALLSGDVPQLKSDWFSVYVGIEFGGEVAADSWSDFLVKFMVYVLIKHGSFSYRRLTYNAKLDDYVLFHLMTR